MLKRLFPILCCILAVLSFNSCYYQQYRTDAWDVDDSASDSLDFVDQHHYSIGYNFVVQADSLPLCTEIPFRAQLLSVIPDSVTVHRYDDLVVAEIAIVPEDVTDSVWIKVARDQETQGWVKESLLLYSVSPDDPISIAIYKFSGNHLWGTFFLIGLVLVVFLMHLVSSRQIRSTSSASSASHLKSPFLRTIFSPYPTLLRLTLSGSAVFYASLQLFAPQLWTEFYFHPTLNPFAVPPLLGAFLFSVWVMLIFFIATVDDCFRQLSVGRAVLYLLVTVTVLAVLYLFFSLSTLVYVGYPLFVLFCIYSVYHYIKRVRPRYRCGHCGAPLHEKGCCPYCGTNNE